MSLEVGGSAPPFRLQSQHGEDVTLAQFRGKQNVVLLFFPFAFSRVCSGELAELRDRRGEFGDDAELLAISCDHTFSLRAFADHQHLEFPLLSDFWPHGEVSRAYGVFNDRAGCPDRSTFVVDREGVVRWLVHSAMSEARVVDDYRRALAAIGSPARSA